MLSFYAFPHTFAIMSAFNMLCASHTNSQQYIQTLPPPPPPSPPESEEEDPEEGDKDLDSDDFLFVPLDDLEEVLDDLQAKQRGRQALQPPEQQLLSSQALLGILLSFSWNVMLLHFCIDAWATLGQPGEAFYPQVFKQRKRSQHQPGFVALIWSVVDLDRVHMHMKVSDLLGSVWAPSVAVHTVASPPAAKWVAEDLDGMFCLDQSWIFVDHRFKQPLVEALTPLLTHPVVSAPHPCTYLYVCVDMCVCIHYALTIVFLVAFLSKQALINPVALLTAMNRTQIRGT